MGFRNSVEKYDTRVSFQLVHQAHRIFFVNTNLKFINLLCRPLDIPDIVLQIRPREKVQRKKSGVKRNLPTLSYRINSYLLDCNGSQNQLLTDMASIHSIPFQSSVHGNLKGLENRKVQPGCNVFISGN